jgi:hypothetical protein
MVDLVDILVSWGYAAGFLVFALLVAFGMERLDRYIARRRRERRGDGE